MSDDSAYEDFLSTANKYTTQPKTSEPSTHSSENLWLTSEMDEPWVDFKLKSETVANAEEFAKLLKQPGHAKYVTAEDDPQYSKVVELLEKKTREKIQVIEIKDGSRIAVYVVYFDKLSECYLGMKSKKIES